MNCNLGQTTILNISRVWSLRGKRDLRLGRLQPADRWPLHGAGLQFGLLCWGLKDRSEDLPLGSSAGRRGLGLDLWVTVLPLPPGSAVLEPHLKTHKDMSYIKSQQHVLQNLWQQRRTHLFQISWHKPNKNISVIAIIKGMPIFLWAFLNSKLVGGPIRI